MLMGAIFSLISFLRYYLGLAGGYVDPDKAIAYCTIGALLISVSYLYERLRQAEFKAKEIEDDLFKATAWIEDKQK